MSVTYVDGTTPLDAAHMNGLLQRDNVATVGTRILASKLLLADTQPEFQIMGDGSLQWGVGGTTAPDSFLRRRSANALQTDGAWNVIGTASGVGYVFIPPTPAGNPIAAFSPSSGDTV